MKKRLLIAISFVILVILSTFFFGVLLNNVRVNNDMVKYAVMELLVYIVVLSLIIPHANYLRHYRKYSFNFMLRKMIVIMIGVALLACHLFFEIYGAFGC